jgi:hypothetical protein
MMNEKQLLHHFSKAITDLEPACDVREWYKDCIDEDCDPDTLDEILIAAVESEELSDAEAEYIKA